MPGLGGQTVLWGTGASVTFPTGGGFLAASARVAVRQGIASATGFGKSWRIKNGTVKDYTVTIAGVLTAGTTSDAAFGITNTPSTGTPATVNMPAGAVAVTVTFGTGCTFMDNMIQSDDSAGISIESAGDAAYTYEGPTSFAGPTITWATA